MRSMLSVRAALSRGCVWYASYYLIRATEQKLKIYLIPIKSMDGRLLGFIVVYVDLYALMLGTRTSIPHSS